MQTPFIQSEGSLISIHIDSPLTENDQHAVCRCIEEKAEAAGKVRLLLVMKQYPSLNSAEDLFDDLRFVRLTAEHIAKVAVVCDRLWKRTFLGLFSLFCGVNMQFFEIADMQAALTWIKTS
jgi:hypothetical protein